MPDSLIPFKTPSVRLYPLGPVWDHESVLCQANQWLAESFDQFAGLAYFDYTNALHGVDNITYPSGIVFLYSEDYIMFKLKFPELIISNTVYR